MLVFLYLLPVLTCIFIFLECPWVGMEWYYYAIVVGLSWAVTWLSRFLLMRLHLSDVEFVSAYITGIRHYDCWTELVVYYEERQVPVGRDSQGNMQYRTERVRKTREVYHPDEFYYFTNSGKRAQISERYYREVAMLWGTSSHFVPVHHANAIIDGDAQEYLLEDIFELPGCSFSPTRLAEGDSYKFIPITEKNHYINKVQGSHSIFRLLNISREEAAKLELHDYPKVVDHTQNPLIGRECSEDEVMAFRLFNAFYGFQHQIHVFVLFFEGKDMSIVEKQRSYWEGGNKNEFVVCLGMNGDTVDWCQTFSWMDEPTLGVKTEAYFREHKQLDMLAFNEWLCEHVDLWKRKEFKDFDYIQPELTTFQSVVVALLTLALNIGIGYYCFAEL